MSSVIEGELVSFPGPWSFLLGRSSLILVRDAELGIIADHPEQELDLSLTFEKHIGSLRSVCEQAQAAGHRTLIVAYDHFFHQYRPGQFSPRTLTPDKDEYISQIAKVSAFAHHYGLGLELSLLSPLEIGPAYARTTGESGVWMHYRKGLRDPKTGAFSVSLRRQTKWENNKGIVNLEDAGVRVFAFTETKVTGTPYRAVSPDEIIELKENIRVEVLVSGDFPQVRIFGHGDTAIPGDRVLVVQHYKTPEMDYFSQNALPYLTKLVDKYADAGVKLNALYSDELHIQQDWIYFSHHDNGQLALRYVSPGFSQAFAAKHGVQYADFAKWLVYFCYGQEDFAHDLSPTDQVMHTFGSTPEAIRETALFRSRYYELLQNGVVELFVTAKKHAEKRMGQPLEARAHATWAESPTIDYWRSGPEPLYQHAYEYTSNFVWSNTVHQAASACHDYFQWGDFLTGNGTDHCECGWADRNYVSLQMASSLGILNEIPYAYSAHWGMPAALSSCRRALENASGCAAAPTFGMVTGMEHRDVDVLFLYPLNLVAVEERFGSWMTQYAYANLITQGKLLERGSVKDGALFLAGRRFSTLVITFEPFPERPLLTLLRQLAEGGGRVVWSGPPPLLAADGKPIRAEWEALFGARHTPTAAEGLLAPGKQVAFAGRFARIPTMPILTDFLVDRLYPVAPHEGTETVATVKRHSVGTHRTVGKGSATYLGFRPRDDQSESLGYDIRTWFDLLDTLGAYPGVDNTERLSRTGDFLCCRFPNGAVGLAPHFKHTEEDWEGGFGRNTERDAAYLARVPAPDQKIKLENFAVNGYQVTYSGVHCLAFRAEKNGKLMAFAGCQSTRITINGHETIFADRVVGEIAWAPVDENRRRESGAVLQLRVTEAVTLTLPAAHLPLALEVYTEGRAPGSKGERVPAHRDGDSFVIEIGAMHANRWLYVLPRGGSMSRKARIAVIGAGWWATTAHLPAVIAHPDAELVALIDPDPERLARAASAFGNPPTYTHLNEALANQALDAAVIATPHASHVVLAKVCLARGLHVLVEKPMTLLTAHARILRSRAEEIGKELIVGYPWNYTKHANTAREWVRSGRLGEIQYVTALFSSYHLDLLSGATREATVHGPTTAYADPKLSGGGHGHLQITHIAGLLFFITDLQIARVQAQMTGFGLPLDVADAGLVTFENGALGVISGTSTSKRSRALLRLDGEKGSLELDPLAGTLSFFGDETETLGPPEEIALTYPYKAPVENLIGVVLGREVTRCPAEVGCRAVELLDALYRSAQSDGAVITREDLQ